MFETASAQPIGLFHSPALSSLERLLTRIGGRIGDLENRFLTRQQSFLDRVFSRHFEAMGLPTRRGDHSSRAVEPVALGLPQSWVPSARALQAAQTGVKRADSTAAAPAALTARRGPTVAPRAAQPSQMPMLTPAAPAADGQPAQVAPAPRSAEQQPAASLAVSSIRPAARGAEPATTLPAAAAPVASSASPTPAQASPATAVVFDGEASALEASLPAPLVSSRAEITPVAEVSRPGEGWAEPLSTDASPQRGAVGSEPAPEPRVRDLLRSIGVVPSTGSARPQEQATGAAMGRVTPVGDVPAGLHRGTPEPAVWSAPGPSEVGTKAVGGPGKARSFRHLNWADSQLSRSPMWRSAALSGLRADTQAAVTPVPVMPVLETPELARVGRPTAAASTLARSAGQTLAPTTGMVSVGVNAAAQRASDSLPAASPVVPAEQAAPRFDSHAVPARLTDIVETSETPQRAERLALGTAEAMPAETGAHDAIRGPAFVAAHAAQSLEIAPLGVDVSRPAGADHASRLGSVSRPAQASIARPATQPVFAQPRQSTLDASLRVDPRVLPVSSSPELAELFGDLQAQPRLVDSLGLSWAQPGGIWSQPAWAQAGILTRLAQVPMLSQPTAWRSAPGVPASVSRSLVSPAGWIATAGSGPRDLPWVAPSALPGLGATQTQAAPIAATGAVKQASHVAGPVATLRPARAAVQSAKAGAGEPVAFETEPTSAPQPWRDVGGVGALAELFAAGVGLGSAAAATQAQIEHETGGPALVADWLRPLLRSRPSLPVGTGTASERALGAPREVLPWLAAPSLDRAEQRPGTLPGSTLRLDATTHAVPATRSTVVRPDRSTTGPIVPPAVAGGVEPQVAVSAEGWPTASASAESDRAWSAPSALRLGGIGLLAQQFAGQQGLRSVSLGLPLRAATSVWAAAPGLPGSLAKELVQRADQTPSQVSRGTLSEGLPYLNVLPTPRKLATQESVATAAADRRSTESGGARPTRAGASAPATAGSQPLAGSGSNTPSAAAAAPWFAPGGGGTLAELFAAGIGTTSGEAAWHGHAPSDRRGLVVPSWISSLLASLPAQPELVTSPGLASPLGLAHPSAPEAPARGPHGTLPLPWVAPTAADRVPARHLANQAASPTVGTVAARPGLRPRVGRALVQAEQFASRQGLVEPAGTAGHWQPVAGGLVWLPAAETAQEAAKPMARPRPSSTQATTGWHARPGAGTSLGSVGLRSELFARAEQSRVLAAGEQISHSLATPTAASAPTVDNALPRAAVGTWRGAGGLVYLPPTQATEAGAQKQAALSSLSTMRSPSRAYVSPLSLAQPWSTLPKELQRLGLSGLSLPRVNPPESATTPWAQTRAALPQVSYTAEPTQRIRPGRLPVLAGPSLATTPMVEPRRSVPSEQPAPRDSRQPYELAARFASSMLTAFPKSDSAGGPARGPDAAKPAMLWPQAESASGARLQRLFAMLPAGLPTTGPLAALAELVKAVPPGSGVGAPLWQRMPAQTALSAIPGGLAPDAALPRAEDADEDSGEADGPSLTLVSGDGSPAARSRREPARAAVPTTKPASPPPIEVFKAALTASGISREQVEASARLMQAMGGAGTGSAGRSDDRLSLDDLTLVAISMGQGRMAASQGGALTSIPSVESALRLPAAQHPSVSQDDKAVRKKIDTMAEAVVKMIKQMKDNQAVRGGFDM